MTPAELEALALGMAKLAFVFGILGAIACHAGIWACHVLVLAVSFRIERAERLAQARMRNVHGPLVLPGSPRWVRRDLIARVLRERHAKAELASSVQGDQWRACERLGGQRASSHA